MWAWLQRRNNFISEWRKINGAFPRDGRDLNGGSYCPTARWIHLWLFALWSDTANHAANISFDEHRRGWRTICSNPDYLLERKGGVEKNIGDWTCIVNRVLMNLFSAMFISNFSLPLQTLFEFALAGRVHYITGKIQHTVIDDNLSTLTARPWGVEIGSNVDLYHHLGYVFWLKNYQEILNGLPSILIL